jgi:hypothetical protein
MRLPCPRIRTLMMVVALSSLICVGVVDVNRPEYTVVPGDDPASFTLMSRTYYSIGMPIVGFIEIGRYPVAVGSWGLAAILLVVWVLVRLRSVWQRRRS